MAGIITLNTGEKFLVGSGRPERLAGVLER
jgi:hypothetical protein